MKIDWIQKLSSRKLWISVAGLVTAILTAFNIDSLTIEQVVTIISGIGALVAYILAEGYIDGKRASADVLIIDSEANDTKE